jgi:hypothetical protein
MANTRFPNLFIVGAPKCGTTALSHYLAGHPQIFMTESAGMKEPYFFSADLTLAHLYWAIRDESSYLKLFEKADPDAVYWGEASATYLFSKSAVSRILQTCTDPRFIVMLRNPVDMVHSHHNEQVKAFAEFPDFEACWRLQASRLNGHDLPKLFTDGIALQYGEWAKTGAQLERMLALVDRSQVHVILYDDFSVDPAASYAALLDWLGLEHDGQAQFEKINPSVTYQWPGLEYALRKIRSVRSALGLPGGLGIHALIDRFNKKHVREPLRPAFRRELCDYFRDDVALLSRLLGRDLSHWLD